MRSSSVLAGTASLILSVRDDRMSIPLHFYNIGWAQNPQKDKKLHVLIL